MLLGRKAMTNLDSMLKSRDITLPTKVHLVKAMVISVVMHGCESWTIKKAECWRTHALWCWRRLFKSPLDCKEMKPVHPKGNQSWVFIGRTDAKAEICSTLATWGKELTHWERPWCWERLKAGEGNNKSWEGWMSSLSQWTWVWASSCSWWWTGKPGVLLSTGSQRVRQDWRTELNWTLCNGSRVGCWKGSGCVQDLHSSNLAFRVLLMSFCDSGGYQTDFSGMKMLHLVVIIFHRWSSGEESTCQCKRHRKCRFDPWIGKIPWSRKWQPTPVFLPGTSHGQKSLAGFRPWVEKTWTWQHTLMSLVLQKSSKTVICVSLEAKTGSGPKTALLFLHCSSLVSASLPFPD